MVSRIIVHGTIAVVGMQAAGEMLTLTNRLDGIVDMGLVGLVLYINSRIATLTEHAKNQDKEIADIRKLVRNINNKAVNE